VTRGGKLFPLHHQATPDRLPEVSSGLPDYTSAETDIEGTLIPLAPLASNTTPHLVVPPPAVAQHPDTIVHPAELAEWLADLPLADSQHLADLLHRQLKLLIRDPHPAAHYRDLLNAYLPVLQSLSEQVVAHFNGAPGMVKTPRLFRNTVSQLLLEIACGYMRLINQAISLEKPPSAVDIYHAALPLVRLLQWDVLQYRLARPGVWRQLLQIFSISELYGLSGVAVSSRLRLDSDAEDTHGAFFGTLVLLLSDPYRLPFTSLSRLVGGLGQLAEHLRINSAGAAEFRIPLDLTGQVPPLRFARETHAGQANDHLQLDEFFGQLQSQGLADDGGILSQWLLDSLRVLAQGVEHERQRHHARNRRNAEYQFFHGLELIHERLSDLQAARTPASGEAGSPDSVVVEEIIDFLPESGTPCRQADHSVEGGRFILQAGTPVPPVGSWVLFEAADTPGGQSGIGFVGQVKRHLYFDNGGSEIGVEKLHGSLIPVSIGVTGAYGLLQADREKQEFLLIGPSGTFRPSARKTLHGRNKEYLVQLDELVEANDAAERIRVRLM